MREMGLWRGGRWIVPGSPISAGVFLAAVGLCGCGGGGSSATPRGDGGRPVETGPEDASPVDNGTIGSVTAVANGGAFRNPLDSTPDPTGAHIYFTGIAADGAGAVFSVAATAGATAKQISTGTVLVAPFGIAISEDGKTLFVADLAANAIFTLNVTGGTPTALAGTDNYRPRSLEVVGTKVYFTGNDPANKTPGAFSVATSGGKINVVAEGAPFVDPSGITADPSGNVYVVDTIAASTRHGSVLRVAAGKVSVLVADIVVGYPAGITLSGDDTALLVSSLVTATNKDQVLEIEIATGSTTSLTPAAIAPNRDAAGLHRAHAADAYSWADSTSGHSGTIYLLTK